MVHTTVVVAAVRPRLSAPRPAIAPVSTSTRRAFGLSVISVLSLQPTMRPAAAVVDGIPLYAPSSGAALPDEGFEVRAAREP